MTASISGYHPLDDEAPKIGHIEDDLQTVEADFLAKVNGVASQMMFGSIPQFKLSIFMRQLATHYFLPFSLLWHTPAYGWQAAANQLFVYGDGQDAYGKERVRGLWATHVLLWSANIICGCQLAADQGAMFFLWPGLLLANVVLLMQYVVVSVKVGDRRHRSPTLPNAA